MSMKSKTKKPRGSIKSINDSKEELNQSLDKANNFIDYFLVIGLNPEIALNDWLYEMTICELNNIYQDKLRPKIISSFPKYQKHTINYDESIIKHCFPNGFKIIESEIPPKPEIFSFILDNNYFSIHYPQKYLSCLICYESVKNYQIIFDKYNNFSPNKLSQSCNIDMSKNSHISSNSTLSNTNNQNSLNNNVNMTKLFFEENNRNYYIPKCLLIISLYPFFGEYEKILSALYKYSQKEEILIPIEKIIENLTIEIPVPPRGVFEIEYTLINKQRIIKQNLMNELPLIDLDMKILFNHFSPEQIVDIYRFIILEYRVLFFSQKIVLLNPFIYGMLSLLYPFHYQYQIITILPKDSFRILESITPFIAGVNQSFSKGFFTEKDLLLSDKIIVVDIDNKKIVIVDGENNNTLMNEDFIDINHLENQNSIPNFPRGIRKNLEKSISTLLSSSLKSSELKPEKRQKAQSLLDFRLSYNGINDPIDFEFNSNIHNAFFIFNTNLLQDYSKYLNIDFYSTKGTPDLTSLFKLEDYLSSLGSANRAFYLKFLSETQIFGDFLFKRMIPKDSNEKIQILSFDEKINENMSGLFSKIPPSIFTTSKEYTFTNTMKIAKPRTPTEHEIEFYKTPENQKEMLKYGVNILQIKQKKEDPEEDYVIFSYPIFPSLTSDLFFDHNIRDYFIPLCLTEEIDLINADIVSKSHLGGVEVQQSDMENYIDLCWIQIWALSFWYCDPGERKYRFNQLISVLEKVTHHEMELFNLLFETISKYGEDYMILELYEMIIQLKLNPSLKVRETVMKMLDKKKFKNLSEQNFLEHLRTLKTEKIQGIQQRDSLSVGDKNKFRKRTFKTKCNANVLNEQVVFYAFDSCINCQKEVNLEILSQNYKEMVRDILWAKCPYCSTLILPKISIKFGNEMNKQGKLKQNTCIFDCVILYSPQQLKLNYNSNLIKLYGLELQIDNFKIECNALFWNSIWYFKLKGLEYDFLLPYENDLDTNILAKLNSHLRVTTSHIAEIEKNKKKKENGNNCIKKIKKFENLQINSSVIFENFNEK